MNAELEKQLIRQVKKDPSSLRNIEEQTEDICLAAIKQDGDYLQYVDNQTETICLAAVKQNPLSMF